MDPVRVWSVPIDRPAPDPGAVRESLSADELDRADAMRRPVDRASFIVRRMALRRVLASELRCEPGAVVFAKDGAGKPSVGAPVVGPGRVTFNVSSCPSLAVIAVSRDVEVGIDVEDRRMIDSVTETTSVVLNASEQRQFDKIAPDLRPGVLLNIWTRKEAVLKAHGTGLLRSPQAITVLTAADNRGVVLADVVDDCVLREVSQQPGVYLAVAVAAGNAAKAASLSVELAAFDAAQRTSSATG